MATYMDLYGAVKRGIRNTPDLAVELYCPLEVVEAAAKALCDAGVLEVVQTPERGPRIQVHAGAADEASAVKKAKAARFDLEAEIPGAG